MKKIILSLSFVMAVTAATFANVVDPDPEVVEAFKREFPGAQLVNWTEQGDYQRATFILAGHRSIAYFNQANELVGCMRDLFFDQLPIVVMKAIDKKFPSASFAEVREINNADGTSYLLTVEQGKKKYKVKLTSEGFFTSTEKIK